MLHKIEGIFMKKSLKWFKLDNSAKVYPILTTDRFTYVFRVSATLYEEINKDILYHAIKDMKKRFPSFYVKLKKGIFWYYFEENMNDPILEVESPFVCQKIDQYFNNRYLFKFYYYNKRISLEMNHVLTDGSGAIVFLNAVIYRYLELLGKDISYDSSILYHNDDISKNELEDGYKEYHLKDEINPPHVERAYLYTKPLFKKQGSGILNSFFDTNSLISLVKESNSSVSQYIVALLIYSIIINGDKKKLMKHPVNICVPVNLRNIYNSKSLFNFSLYFHVSYKMKDFTPDFEDILSKVKEDFKNEYTPEKIQSKLDTIYSIQQRYFIRLIPLPIKWIIFKIGYNTFGRKPTTITFSNLGKVNVPKSLEDNVESYSFYMGSGQKHAVAMNSYKGKSSVVFSRAVIDTDLERTFFNHLSEKGLDIKIESNYWEVNERGFKLDEK